MFHDSRSSLEGVAPAPELRHEAEANIRMRQTISLNQSTHAHRPSLFPGFDQIHSEAKNSVDSNKICPNIRIRILRRSDSLVADILQPRRLVQKPAQKKGVSRFHLSQDKTFCVSDELRHGFFSDRYPELINATATPAQTSPAA